MQIPESARQPDVNERFLDLASIVGGDIALYCLCAAYNLPVYAEEPIPSWTEYLNILDGIKRTETFIDGETDVESILLRGATEAERWESEWGTGDPDNPYTAKDYKTLDSIFKTYSSRLDAAGGMDAQQEDTLRHCTRMALLRDKCIAKGDTDSIKKAATLDKMIQDNFSSENLRKKDAKPIENARVDGIIDAMQKKYGVSAEMTKAQFLEIFFKWCHSKRYPETVDAAEYAMLAIINTMRANNDLPDVPELPKEASGMSAYAEEFAPEPNETEQGVYEYLNLTRKDGWVPKPEDPPPVDTVKAPDVISDFGIEGFYTGE